MTSALYVGEVHHVRRSPKRHKLNYRVFHLMLDLDDWHNLDKRSHFLAVDRRGVMSVSQTDYISGDKRPLRAKVEALLNTHGVFGKVGRIRLFTYPRIFGYLFNPVSLFLCEDISGQPHATIYEVNNTFGERHHYVIPMTGKACAVHEAEKAFYVSPFMETSGQYRFKVSEKGDRFALAMESVDADGNSLNASFRGIKRPLDASQLRRAFFRFPLMSFKIIAGIHFEALKLWLKGLKVYRHKEAPRHPRGASVGQILIPGRKSQ